MKYSDAWAVFMRTAASMGMPDQYYDECKRHMEDSLAWERQREAEERRKKVDGSLRQIPVQTGRKDPQVSQWVDKYREACRVGQERAQKALDSIKDTCRLPVFDQRLGPLMTVYKGTECLSQGRLEEIHACEEELTLIRRMEKAGVSPSTYGIPTSSEVENHLQALQMDLHDVKSVLQVMKPVYTHFFPNSQLPLSGPHVFPLVT
jgi:hypothetical protein